MTNYNKSENDTIGPRVHKIHGLARIPNSRDLGNSHNIRFRCEKLSPTIDVSVKEYFEKVYNVRLQYPLGVVVDVGSRDNPIYLPAELCRVVKGQRYLKKLSASQTSEMIKAAVKPPKNNYQAITNEGMKILGMSPERPVLDAFGLVVEPQMITVPGRILSAPSLVYKTAVQHTQHASWNMASLKFINARSVSKWAILRLFPRPDTRENSQVNGIDQRKIAVLHDVLGRCGFDPGSHQSPDNYWINLSGEDQNEKRIQEMLEKISKNPPGILLVILPNDNKHTYSRIKFWADFKLGIHTVCLVAKKICDNNDQKLKQYFANVGLKINLKMGGTNQLIKDDKLGIVKGGMTMLVGIDVTHPSPSSIQGAPSIAGVVASIDKKLAQWPASIRAQQSRKEIVSELEAMMVERLEVWQAKNSKNLPDKILVYRDGVSESQYKAVLDEELPSLQDACKKVYPAKKKPKISIIVVGKRHHTRFFPAECSKTGRNGNPQNGTIVDRGITMQNGWDFFLQAHEAVQGTARPAHYVVIHDEIGLGVNALENLTHNLCYLYGRATKAVSVCPPAYYADLVCERGRCYLYRELNDNSALGSEPFNPAGAPWSSGVHPNLADSMFYI